MALRTPPSWLQNGSHSAENDRLTNQSVWKSTGIINTGDLTISQNGTPNMTVNAASGWAAILGNYQTNMGVYMAYNDATTNLTITTANATNPRIDLVCITVSDAYYTGSVNTGAFNVVAGTPAASPTVPATPTNSIALAQIAVGAGVTSILTANITNYGVKASSPTVGNIVTAKGDIVTATASGTPSNLPVGSDGQTLVANSSTSTGLSYTAGTVQANPVLNSATAIWQRGTSITYNASVGYFADRWYGYSVPAATFSRQATNDTTNLPFIQYCMRIQRNSGSTNTGLIQISQSLETVNSIPYAGKTVTLSYYARAGANYSAASNGLSANIGYGTGTDQNIQSGYTGATNAGSTSTLTTTWQRFTYTTTISATATELGLFFAFTPTGTAGANDYYEITGVQIDIGSVALPFRTFSQTLQGELAACQRYYFRNTGGGFTAYNPYANGGTISTTGAYISFPFPQQMRVAPTAVEFSGIAVQTSSGTLAALSNLTMDQVSGFNASLAAITASSWTANQPCRMINNNNVNGYVGFTAEL